ncbi:MAG TPA: hypothetical protein VHI53_10430 [Gaiellaceae bacterium]|nr:hypothetical protein [Gaiellaceae bacterium]
MNDHQEPRDEAQKDDDAQKETAQGEGLPEAPEDLPPPALGHGTASKESALNRAATQTSVMDRLRSFFRGK